MDNDLVSRDCQRSILIQLQVVFAEVNSVSSALAAGPEKNTAESKKLRNQDLKSFQDIIFQNYFPSFPLNSVNCQIPAFFYNTLATSQGEQS